jgi:hypothetical protein
MVKQPERLSSHCTSVLIAERLEFVCFPASTLGTLGRNVESVIHSVEIWYDENFTFVQFVPFRCSEDVIYDVSFYEAYISYNYF